MTIICALFDAKVDETWIGSDSQGSVGHFIWPQARKKIVRCGEWAIGASGSSLTGRVLRERAEQIADCATVEQIADLMIGEMKSRDFKPQDDKGPPNYGQELVIASRAGVWGMFCDGSTAPADFVAAGSGCEYAYGVWHALSIYLPNLSGKNIIEAAVDAAIRFDDGCGGPVQSERVR